ncbi:MAG: hypothetical protein EOM67_17200 [Spirochaetia bacterium]|nr:hypothetical protein [Spirochaetia bacterium]
MTDDSTIIKEMLDEFEFDGFSVFHTLTDVWYLETDADDEDRIEILLQEQGVSLYDDNREDLIKIGFTGEDFTRLKEFVYDKNA